MPHMDLLYLVTSTSGSIFVDSTLFQRKSRGCGSFSSSILSLAEPIFLTFRNHDSFWLESKAAHHCDFSLSKLMVCWTDPNHRSPMCGSNLLVSGGFMKPSPSAVRGQLSSKLGSFRPQRRRDMIKPCGDSVSCFLVMSEQQKTCLFEVGMTFWTFFLDFMDDSFTDIRSLWRDFGTFWLGKRWHSGFTANALPGGLFVWMVKIHGIQWSDVQFHILSYPELSARVIHWTGLDMSPSSFSIGHPGWDAAGLSKKRSEKKHGATVRLVGISDLGGKNMLQGLFGQWTTVECHNFHQHVVPVWAWRCQLPANRGRRWGCKRIERDQWLWCFDVFQCFHSLWTSSPIGMLVAKWISATCQSTFTKALSGLMVAKNMKVTGALSQAPNFLFQMGKTRSAVGFGTPLELQIKWFSSWFVENTSELGQ